MNGLEVDRVEYCPPIVVGGGVAGMRTALGLPEAVLLTEGAFARDGSTALAQGGTAAVLARRESRGAHYRSNFRRTNPILAQRRATALAPAPTESLTLDAAESPGFVPA